MLVAAAAIGDLRQEAATLAAEDLMTAVTDAAMVTETAGAAKGSGRGQARQHVLQVRNFHVIAVVDNTDV